MKSRNLLKLCLVLLISVASYGQTNGNAYYKKQSTHNFDNIKGVNNNQNVKSSFKSVNNSINDMEFVLMFNDSLALYEEIEKLDSDSRKSSEGLSSVFSGYKGPYYYNLKTSKSQRKQGKYLIENNLKNYNWVLTKEKLILNNLTCYKATTTLKLEGRSGEIIRSVTAWYTPSIGIQLGPDGFGGLPGLIIQLEVNKVVTTLERIEFLEKSIKIDVPTKGEKMTEEEFKVLIKDLVENREKYYNKN
jgi:GLPGLI family protein